MTGLHPHLSDLGHRQLGAYFTPPTTASFMARWAIRSANDVVVEPSMGDGAFVSAASSRLTDLGTGSGTVWGVEYARDTFDWIRASGLIDSSRAILSDFFDVKPFGANVVIGNPPFVRVRNLASHEAEKALAATEATLGEPMNPSGSTWMPFVLHATRFLMPGGRLAFVLPYELTYVAYARPLWRFLKEHFGSIRVLRVHERLFPDILQECVVLLADEFGGATDQIEFCAYESLDRMVDERPDIQSHIAAIDLADGRARPFITALLSDSTRELLADLRSASKIEQAGATTDFRIGYIAGDNSFFHPSKLEQEHYGLDGEHLVPALTASRALRRAGLRTSAIEGRLTSSLFLPRSRGDAESYIRSGEKSGVDQRYNCRVRDPWFVVPRVRVPDYLLPVFGDHPLLLENDQRFVASNSLLCGYAHGESEDLLARWYSTLTLLSTEQAVHSLGGGVLVLVPREVAAIEIPKNAFRANRDKIDAAIRRGDYDAAFELGDAAMGKSLGLASADIDTLREGVATLRRWRASRK